LLEEGITVPFESRFARAFTAVNIERDAPTVSGVYGVSNAKSWIFIDETENIRASLMGYLANSSGSSVERPSGFSFELSPAYSRTARRDRLIAELAPTQQQAVAATPKRRSRG
jgi:carbohydrate-binding DOMON domain-containing protein